MCLFDPNSAGPYNGLFKVMVFFNLMICVDRLAVTQENGRSAVKLKSDPDRVGGTQRNDGPAGTRWAALLYGPDFRAAYPVP